MRFVSLLVLALVAVLVVAMGWQHIRYLKWRRASAQDHQPLLHSSAAFHVISYLRLESGGDLVSKSGALVGRRGSGLGSADPDQDQRRDQIRHGVDGGYRNGGDQLRYPTAEAEGPDLGDRRAG